MQNAVQGGDPISHSGFSSLTRLRTSCRSALSMKFQGVPSGFVVRKSNASRPLTLSDLRALLASVTMLPWPYTSIKVPACSFPKTLFTKFLAASTSVPFATRADCMALESIISSSASVCPMNRSYASSSSSIPSLMIAASNSSSAD